MPRRTAPALLLLLALACATPRAPAPSPGAGPDPAARPEEVLRRFALAVRAGRWAEAWPLLSARWRASTSPGRLAADWRGAGPVAREAADRVVALLEAGGGAAGGGVLMGEGPARKLPVGPGREARLVAEPDGWRVDALE